jgi:hypothetical protein
MKALALLSTLQSADMTCSAVRKLVKDRMAELGVERTDGDQKLSDFWKSTYLPHVKQNLASSTLVSYDDMWTRRIEPRFGKLILTEVKSSQITEFLSGLSNLNRNSVNHHRSLLGGIFSHAAALGKVPFNPVREARVLSKPKPNQETKAYSFGPLREHHFSFGREPESANRSRSPLKLCREKRV